VCTETIGKNKDSKKIRREAERSSNVRSFFTQQFYGETASFVSCCGDKQFNKQGPI